MLTGCPQQKLLRTSGKWRKIEWTFAGQYSTDPSLNGRVCHVVRIAGTLCPSSGKAHIICFIFINSVFMLSRRKTSSASESPIWFYPAEPRMSRTGTSAQAAYFTRMGLFIFIIQALMKATEQNPENTSRLSYVPQAPI